MMGSTSHTTICMIATTCPFQSPSSGSGFNIQLDSVQIRTAYSSRIQPRLQPSLEMGSLAVAHQTINVSNRTSSNGNQSEYRLGLWNQSSFPSIPLPLFNSPVFNQTGGTGVSVI
jgi:hypothetical protein